MFYFEFRKLFSVAVLVTCPLFACMPKKTEESLSSGAEVSQSAANKPFLRKGVWLTNTASKIYD